MKVDLKRILRIFRKLLTAGGIAAIALAGGTGEAALILSITVILVRRTLEPVTMAPTSMAATWLIGMPIICIQGPVPTATSI